MKKNKLIRCICIASTTLLGLSSCTSEEDKALKIISELDTSDCIVSTNMIGESKSIITSELQKDSTITIRVYDLATEKSDSIFSLIKGSKVWEVAPVNDDSYLIVTSVPRQDGNEHNLFFSFILRNVHNPKTSTKTQLFVDEGSKNLAATSYTIDPESRKLTLSSWDNNSSSATIYHTVYDFDGNKIISDPATIEFKAPNNGSGSSGSTYIWECQRCHVKINSTKKPSNLEGLGCNGSWRFHTWVKIGRVD